MVLISLRNSPEEELLHPKIYDCDPILKCTSELSVGPVPHSEILLVSDQLNPSWSPLGGHCQVVFTESGPRSIPWMGMAQPSNGYRVEPSFLGLQGLLEGFEGS